MTRGWTQAEFSLADYVPHDLLLRSIDRFSALSPVRAQLSDFYSHSGRPSTDPDLLIRLLFVGYCFGIRSERRLFEEVHLNLAYRWFCLLDLTDRIPGPSPFFQNRHGRFRESDPEDAPRAARAYLNTLDEVAFGTATTAKPRFTAHADRSRQWTTARSCAAFFAYSDNYLIGTDRGIIADVGASHPDKIAEVGRCARCPTAPKSALA